MNAGGQGLPGFALSHTASSGKQARESSKPRLSAWHPTRDTGPRLTHVNPTSGSQELEGSVLSQNGVACLGL